MKSEKEVREYYKVKEGNIVLIKKKTYEVAITFSHFMSGCILIYYTNNNRSSSMHCMYYCDNFSVKDIEKVSKSIKKTSENKWKILELSVNHY